MDEALRHYQLQPVDGLMLSIVVLYLGLYLNRHIAFLRDNYIPPAVTGGLICSAVVWGILATFDLEISFDLQIRDILLLVFFSTVGLSAKLRTLAAGGKALAILIVVAGIFLVVQDVTGIGLAVLLGAHPGYGLMGGSVSFAGGHGTAIAWGDQAVAAGLVGANEIGVAFATFGLIAGGLLGGPVARLLIARERLAGPQVPGEEAIEEASEHVQQQAPPASLFDILTVILVLAICVEAGDFVNRFLFDKGVLLPGFLTSMFVGIVITNLTDVVKVDIHPEALQRFGDVALNIFLAMSLMSMQLWTLASEVGIIMVVLMVQVLVMTLFAIFVVFRVMGRDYDACVISAGFVGLGLGATPVAIANMDALTRRFGPSPKAFLVVPLVGAFFIDIMNAIVIKTGIGLITKFLV
ncbi:MAG: sodium/glutamate symporter [Pseudomonadota bacterium]